MRICTADGCPEICDGPRCPVHQRVHERQRGSRQARGYNNAHVQLRKQWAARVAQGNVQCARCGQPIDPHEPFDLGHTDDRTAYSGPEHSNRCNRAAGGRASHR